MLLERTWRWFGPNDTITLSDLKQMGVEGVVTSLNQFKPGEIWPADVINATRTMIERNGLRWSVVESLPVSEDIKKGTSKATEHIDNYIVSLHNLAKCGIDRVCYNFMPVIDWVRTDLSYKDEDGTETMLYDPVTFAAFDLFILKRNNAEADYTDALIHAAKNRYENMSESDRDQLAYNLIVVTQSFINSAVEDREDYINAFKTSLEEYRTIGEANFRNNFSHFISKIVPVAERLHIKMSIHPDDPPFPLLGLPRIASTIEDFQWIFSQAPSLSNGFAFCIGSLGARKENDLTLFLDRFAERIHFAHLRNLKYLDEERFYESGHIDGDLDLFGIIRGLLSEQSRRLAEGREDFRIPFRPDHGKKMLDDFSRRTNPGYPLIGRLKGLSEISGIEHAILRNNS